MIQNTYENNFVMALVTSVVKQTILKYLDWLFVLRTILSHVQAVIYFPLYFLKIKLL